MPTIRQYIPATADDWDMGSVFDATHTTVSLGRNATVDMKYGMRFSSVPIPAGATITSAVITFKAQQTRNDSPVVRIFGIAADNPTAPTTSGQEAALTRTTSYVQWTIAAQTVNTTFDSPDISAPIQEVVNRAGWAYGNALIVTVDNYATDATRLASIYARDSSSGTNAPYLTITWTHPTKSGVQIAVAASADDCACPTNLNAFNNSANNISLGRSTVSGKALFRFQNVTIPQGATIEHARLVMRLTGGIGATPAMAIKGADADDVSAPANQAGADAISRTSASVAWTPSANTAVGTNLITADFASVVQEIVDRVGWSSGNALGVFLENTDGSGSTSASVYTYDGQVAASLGNCSPLLEVRYTTPSTGGPGRMLLCGLA